MTIADGPERYPDSAVLFTFLAHERLREMFAYLREREEIVQTDLKKELPLVTWQDLVAFITQFVPAQQKATVGEKVVRAMMTIRAKTRLEEIESLLIWMAHNVEKIEKPKGHNHGNGPSKQLEMEQILSDTRKVAAIKYRERRERASNRDTYRQLKQAFGRTVRKVG
jgi:hypothetical protein